MDHDMYQAPNHDDGEYPAQQPQPQRRESAPQPVYDPAGYSVKPPLPEKRDAVLRSTQAGEKNYQEYKENKAQRLRAITQGPPRTLGGKSLSQTELQEKWISEEAHAKRNQLIADYEKKERRREYQRQEKARQDEEIQEKKLRAREIAIKQARTERDRTIAHGEVLTQQRLQHFDPNFTSSLQPKRLTESERAEKQAREDQEAFKQKKLDEHAKQQRRGDYKREEREREERENMQKKMRARELAIKQSDSGRERVAADSEIARQQRQRYYDAKK